MLSIGASELLLVAVIGVLVLGAPVAVLIWLLTRRNPPAAVPAGMIECRTCGKPISQQAVSCPSCREPLG